MRKEQDMETPATGTAPATPSFAELLHEAVTKFDSTIKPYEELAKEELQHLEAAAEYVYNVYVKPHFTAKA